VESIGATVRTLTPEMVKRLRYQRPITGIIVVSVEPDGLAEREDLRPGDIITGVGNRDIESAEEFDETMGRTDLSRGAVLNVIRENMMGNITLRE
jgi:serine protease Do